ncbi:MAG: VOC family protein [Candidatus Binataceae bacterium]
MICPQRIGHVVIKVRDLERSRRFYTEVMGLRLMAELPKIKMAFFASDGRDHHEIAVVEVGADAPAPQSGQVGLVHIAFRLRDEDHLRAAYQELKEKQVPILSTVDHGITKSIYFRDPDGNQLEIYCDNPPEYIARMRENHYGGMDKLEFAANEPGLADVLPEMMK